MSLIQFFSREGSSEHSTPPPNDETTAIPMEKIVSSTPAISVTQAEPSNRFKVVDLESSGGTVGKDDSPVLPVAAKNRFTVRNCGNLLE